MSYNRVPQHTAGVWTIHERLTASENHAGYAIRGHGGRLIAEVYPLDIDPTEEAKANGRLIASAPAFYAACAAADEFSVSPLDWLSAMLNEYQERSYQSQDPDAAATCARECRRLLDALKAAMAAAGGE